MHYLCESMNDSSFEDSLFSKYLLYLKENHTNEDKSWELNKTMIVMANMIEIFSLQSETSEEYWKILYMFLEVMLDKHYKNAVSKTNRIRITSGVLSMLAKIWIRWPKILKEKTELLSYFWNFVNQEAFDENEKVVLLDIYNDFLTDFQKLSSSENSSLDINVGDFIDSLKIDVKSCLQNIFVPNKNLRLITFKVFKQSYYIGLVPFTQAAELFLICLNDNITEVDPRAGTKICDESLEVLRDICK